MTSKSGQQCGLIDCVHCHLCQKNCRFLEKHKIDIGDISKHPDLLYHCFLCGKCTSVCPKGIDGREEILNLRCSHVQKNKGTLKESGYGMLLLEKKDYIFRNHKKGKKKSVLFPGCNFPSFYPKTTKKLVELLKQHDIGVIYDCCGKPIGELGLKKEEEKIRLELEERLKKLGVEEVVTLCPNCYYFLRGRLNVPVVNIYEKMKELGLKTRLEGGESVFLPCPDRKEEKWWKDIQQFLKKDAEVICEVQCCGLGGGAAAKESEISRNLGKAICEGRKDVYVYCASCACNLARSGGENVHHYLPELLGEEERPDIKKSLLNRARTKIL